MLDLLSDLKPAPFRPQFNLGYPYDIMTGRWHTGAYGESILNGGMSHLTGISGRGNTFKTSLEMDQMLTVLDQIKESVAAQYDTEMSQTVARFNDIAPRNDSLVDLDLEETDRFRLTDKTVYNGTEWFAWLKTKAAQRHGSKEMLGTTPFIDNEGKPIKALYPFMAGVDSMSQFTTANVLKIQEAADIGDSGRNVEAIRDAGAKTQMLMELPTLTARGGLYVIMTAHMGDDLALDPYAPPQKKLAFLKNKVKLKNVPEKFTFLVNNCWHVMSTEVLFHKDSKAPLYPRDAEDDLKGDSDLQLLKIQNLRGKFGATGLSADLIVSQSEGVLRGLSEFYYLKTSGNYGISGTDRNYSLDLCPDIPLSRTTVRAKIDETPKLKRALQICAEMLQMRTLWHDMDQSLICSPKELFVDLKARGYDWDVLLATRGYWVFNNDKHPVPYLSTMDLLNMRAGTYKPYWL